MKKQIIIFTDSGDTIVDEETQQIDENDIVISAELIPGAKQTLLELYREGYRIALVADGKWDSFQNVFRQHGLLDCFEALIVSERVGCEKPDVKMFDEAMKQMKLTQKDKQKIVMIGNNLKKDIAGANRFGITSVWLNWSKRYYHTIEEPDWKAIYEISLPKELPDLLAKLEKQI